MSILLTLVGGLYPVLLRNIALAAVQDDANIAIVFQCPMLLLQVRSEQISSLLESANWHE